MEVVESHRNDHPIPPQTFDKLPTVIKQGITKKIVAFKDLGATALIVGNTKRTSLYEDFPGNPAVLNRDGVHRLKAATLKSDGKNTILDVLAVYLESDDLVVSHSIGAKDFHLCMQDDRCREFANEIQYPIESNAVEGFLKVTRDFPALFNADKATSVMITSSHNVVTSRWSRLLITLMGGRTNKHYYHHFKVLLRTLFVAGDDYNDFVENFPGHTTDFSIAQTNGFLQALREYIQQRFTIEKTDYELRTDLDIRYCTVQSPQHVCLRKGGGVAWVGGPEGYEAQGLLTKASKGGDDTKVAPAAWAAGPCLARFCVSADAKI